MDQLVRLPQVQITSTVTFSDDTTSTVLSTMKNFRFWDIPVFIEQVRHVRVNIRSAITGLQGFLDNREDLDALPTQVSRWFAGPDYELSMGYDALTEIKATYTAIATLLSTGVTYYDDTNDTDYGHEGGPYNSTESSDVSIGQLSWTGREIAPLDLERYGSVIHELSHVCFPTGVIVDKGYFNNPAALQNETAEVEWFEDAYGQFPVGNPLTTEELMSNADSFAGYLTQYYYTWGPFE